MALLIIRTGCSPSRIADSYGPTNLPIPKAPGVGLLLEQPLFNSYNKKITSNTNPGIPDRQTISFELSQEKIDAFKEKFIYQRMFYEEEKGNLFHSFVGFIDGFKNPAFTYLGSKGLKIVEEAKKEGTWLASGKEIKQPGPDGSEDEDDEVLLDVETG